MPPPPSSRGGGEAASRDVEFSSPPKSPKQQQNLLPKISEDDVAEDDAKQKKASSLQQQQQMTMQPQFALNSPMEAAIAPSETILKAELMEGFLTNASTTEKKDEQQRVVFDAEKPPPIPSAGGDGAHASATATTTFTTTAPSPPTLATQYSMQNSSDNSDDDTSYHGKRKNFLFSKDDGRTLTNEQRQIRKMLQLAYFLLHAAVIVTLVLAVVWNSRLFGFISITLGGTTVINFVVTGLQAIFLEPSTHVVGKRLYFILNGVQKEFVNLLHGVLCLCCWTYYVRAEDMVNKSDLKEYWYLMTYRIIASWVARCCMHLVSRAIFNYMLVDLQRRVYSDQMLTILIEEFALMKLFKAIVPQREIYNVAHKKLLSSTNLSNLKRVGSTSTLLQQYAGFGHATFPVGEEYIIQQHGIMYGGVKKKVRTFEPMRERGGQLMGGTTVQETVHHQMTLTRAARLARYIKRYNLRIPRMFADRANQTFIKDEPLIIDDIILDESVASTCGTRLAITLRKIQKTKRLRINYEFLKSLGVSKEIAQIIMDIFDVDKQGFADRDMIIDRVIEIYESRKNMQLTLGGSRSVLATLERMMLTALYTVLIFIVLAIFDQNVLEMWLTLSSFILAFAFMFGNSIRECFEGVIFIFITHPYDVGDNILINGNRYVIKNINILQTETENWNGEVTYYHNQTMMRSTVINMSRSKTRTESFDWIVDVETPDKIFDGLNSSLHNFTALNSADVDECFIKVVPCGDHTGKIRITVFLYLKFNGLPVLRSLAVRNALNNHVRKYFVANSVKLHGLPLTIDGHLMNSSNGTSSGGGGAP